MARTPPWHPGEPHPQVFTRAAARLRVLQGQPGLPHVGDGADTAINLIDSYAELIAVSMARARFLGELLAEQFAEAQATAGEPGNAVRGTNSPRDGDPAGLGGPATAAGLVGYTYSGAVVGMGEDATYETVATGEETRGLVRLEAEERDRAARLVKDAIRIGLDLEKIEVMRGYAATATAAMRALIAELGLDCNAEPVLRAAGRAGLTARRTLGHDDGDPDVHAGPALSTAEQARVLGDALTRVHARSTTGELTP